MNDTTNGRRVSDRRLEALSEPVVTDNTVRELVADLKDERAAHAETRKDLEQAKAALAALVEACDRRDESDPHDASQGVRVVLAHSGYVFALTAAREVSK